MRGNSEGADANTAPSHVALRILAMTDNIRTSICWLHFCEHAVSADLF